MWTSGDIGYRNNCSSYYSIHYSIYYSREMIHKNDGSGRIAQLTKQRMGVVTVLPIGPVGVPEATTVLCGGNGELIRALALALAILSVLIIVRAVIRVARNATGSIADSMTSLLASVLPGLYLGWLTVAGSDVIGCLFTDGRIQQLFDGFMAIGITIANTIG